MISNAEAKRQRKALLAEIAAEHLRKDRARIVELRALIRDVKKRRQAAMLATRAKCKTGAAAARERAKQRVIAIREQAREFVRTARREEILKARAVCNARKARIRASALGARAKRKQELEAERAFQREMHRINQWANRRRQHARATAVEKRQESDDEVRQNLPPEFVPLFEKIKRSIKGSTRHSRTEELMHYAEEHPAEVVDAQVELSQREIAKLIHEQAKLERQVRRPRAYKATAAELADIPF